MPRRLHDSVMNSSSDCSVLLLWSSSLLFVVVEEMLEMESLMIIVLLTNGDVFAVDGDDGDGVSAGGVDSPADIDAFVSSSKRPVHLCVRNEIL